MRLHLIIVSLNFKNGEYCVLVDKNGEIPSKNIDILKEQSPEDICKDIITQYTNLSNNWIVFYQLEEKDNVYYSYLPYIIKVTDGKWVNYQTLKSNKLYTGIIDAIKNMEYI